MGSSISPPTTTTSTTAWTAKARWLAPLALVLGAACVPTYKAGIQGDLESRYPHALATTRTALAEIAAVTLVLFVAWLAADVALRSRDRHDQGGPLLTAAAIAGVLLAATLVVVASGPFPQGLVYKVAAEGVFWLGPAALIAGVVWLVRGFRSGPGDQGEAVWGLYLVLVGLFLIPALFGAMVSLWICAGDC
jgi:hypothetical protein